ncbi:MAG: phytochelatin synthase family protein [Xenococcus sp. MO_188.B8]|nr:phytochelatin synthase family protein [Xenococcus sp. MO_188.B8]
MFHYSIKDFIRVCFSFLVIVGATTFVNCGIAQTTSKSEELIVLDSEVGEQLLFSSQARSDYLPLSLEFVTQDNLAYCGVATLVMVLNALDIEAPVAANHKIPGVVSYRFFTQENVFENKKTDDVIKPELIAKQGMTLEELGGLFKSYPVVAETFHGEDISLEQFRKLAVQNLQQPGNFLVVNYLRRSLGQKGGGHISPVAAYHEQSDQFLILDVARYRYSPVWVEAEALWEAMNTIDSASGKTRGLVMLAANDTVD